MRSGGGFGLALAFFAILVLLTPLAVGDSMALLGRLAAGILWLGALLSCLLSLERLFSLDFEDGSLEQYAIAPLPLEGVVLAKALAHWITTGVPLAVLAVPLGVTLNLPSAAYGALAGGLLIGTPALSMIGAFGAALTVGVKRGGTLLSLVVLPLYIPTLILGAEVARRAADGLAMEQGLVLLGGLSAGILAVMPFAGATALRISLR